MSDMLLDLSKNPQARKVIRTLGLPLPLPQPLRRAGVPWEAQPLRDRYVVFGAAPKGALAAPMAQSLAEAGANVLVAAGDEVFAAFKAPCEAEGRAALKVLPDSLDVRPRIDAVVYDATGISTPEGLRGVYDVLHPLMGRLKANARVVVLGRAPDHCDSAVAASAQQALDGFVRSVAKELGKRGSTAQLVQVEAGAEDRVDGVLRFLLSDRSAFVTGQCLRVHAGLSTKSEIRWTRPLDGKVAVVTGAARGIGAATAKLLAAEGAQVVCLDRPEDEDPLCKVAADVGGMVLAIDVTAPEAPETIAKRLQDRFGGVDIVVHNAGITRDKTLARMQPEKWDQVIDVNLAAVVRITERLLDGVMRDDGRIICLSSMAGIAGNLGQTNYTASKAGIIGYVRKLSERVASRGISVNAVAPGFIETRMTAVIPVAIREVGRRLSSLSQGGLPQDVGEVITFLAAPSSSGLTGSVIRVCGGSFLGA